MQRILVDPTLDNAQVIAQWHALLNNAEQFIQHSSFNFEDHLIGCYLPSLDSNTKIR